MMKDLLWVLSQVILLVAVVAVGVKFTIYCYRCDVKEAERTRKTIETAREFSRRFREKRGA